ncbi:hypothetical protein [Roseivivax lentus]|nr:hypothetical protein [Roseivivax lentus]
MFSPLNLVNGALILVILVSLAFVVSSGRVDAPQPLEIGQVLSDA